MRKPAAIAPLGTNKLVVITTNHELWLYQEIKGKPKWAPLEPMPQHGTEPTTIREKLKPVWWLLAKHTIMGDSYFTGATFSENPDRAQRYTPQKADEVAALTSGTFPRLLSEAEAEWKARLGPKQRTRKKRPA